jgi:hypothetical protein
MYNVKEAILPVQIFYGLPASVLAVFPAGHAALSERIQLIPYACFASIRQSTLTRAIAAIAFTQRFLPLATPGWINAAKDRFRRTRPS